MNDASEEANTGPTTESAPEPAPLLELREVRPPVIETTEALQAYCRAVADGSGPVAIDAERASGYRYSQRAYLIQVRRDGAGIGLIDPLFFEDLGALQDAIGTTEWILHAASQDLVCLAEVGLRPHALFDTELAGRLLNLPRVGLATLVEHYFGRTMAKEHSAADWSTRPLPDSWLDYAALDVEVLCELRGLLADELAEAGKLEWARQEFDALLTFTGPERREEPWRRTSGMHRARGRRALGIVRSVWEARDAIAQQRDVAPGRILADASIVELAVSPPPSLAELKGMRIMRNRGPRRFLDQWMDAVTAALDLPERDLPTASQRREGLPPPRTWTDKNPDAADRLGRCREVVAKLSAEHNLPSENLISPGVVRALAWTPPEPISAGTTADALAAAGARPWQVELTSVHLAGALTSR
ncbi:MAG TPA: ribonuclease D [Aeromicrobium sp.]|nr:ribonuclease D [Aeromicrobium sp.]